MELSFLQLIKYIYKVESLQEETIIHDFLRAYFSKTDEICTVLESVILYITCKVLNIVKFYRW